MSAALPFGDVDAIARRVVELLREDPALTTRQLVDAGTLATILGVDRAWIYDHAADLGAYRLGTGDRPRLRFSVDRALAAWSQHAEAVEPAPVTPAPRRRASARAAELLPIHRGRRAA